MFKKIWPCPPWPTSPKDPLCETIIIERTSDAMSSFDKEIPDPTGILQTQDTGTRWAAQDIGAIEVYKKGNTTITVTIDPLIKKDIRLNWTYEFSDLEIPTSDTNTGYDDAGVGFTDSLLDNPVSFEA